MGGLIQDHEGLALAIEQALEAAELPLRRAAETQRNRLAPRGFDLAGLAERIVAFTLGASAFKAAAPEAWTLAKARAAVDGADDRHQIIRTALRFALKTFDFAAAFAVVGGNAVGWAAQAREGAADEGVERISIPLDAPSVLRTVLLTKGRYLGSLPGDPLSQSLAADLGRPRANSVFLHAVEVRDRPVAIFYGDVNGRAISERDVGEFVVFAQHLGQRIEKLIVDQKRRLDRAAREAGGALPGEGVPAPAFALEPPTLTTAELFARSAPRPRGGAKASGDAAPSAVLAAAPAPGASSRLTGASLAMPSSMDDLFEAAERLLDPDLGERAKALALLSRFPEVAAAVLVARFPGPVLRSRVPVSELPSPEELGPIPAALARMGVAAARALVPLFEHRDVDSRYFALLTAGRLPAPVLVGPIALRVFDRHPIVAGAARVALASMRGVQGFGPAVAKIRAELASRDSETANSAAKALGLLRDAGSVEALIGLTGHENKALAQSSADALREITKQPLGQSPARWSDWWAGAKLKAREEWLLEALRHKDLENPRLGGRGAGAGSRGQLWLRRRGAAPGAGGRGGEVRGVVEGEGRGEGGGGVTRRRRGAAKRKGGQKSFSVRGRRRLRRAMAPQVSQKEESGSPFSSVRWIFSQGPGHSLIWTVSFSSEVQRSLENARRIHREHLDGVIESVVETVSKVGSDKRVAVGGKEFVITDHNGEPGYGVTTRKRGVLRPVARVRSHDFGRWILRLEVLR